MSTLGLDVSHYQSGLNPDAADLNSQGYAFLLAKASEGSFYSDPHYSVFAAQARAEGLLFAAYHFLSAESAVTQANRCASAIGDKSIPVMIDLEAHGARLSDATAFRAAMHRLGYRVTLLYLPHWYWQQIGSPNLAGWTVVSSAYPSSAHAYGSALYPGDNASGWSAYGGVVPTLYQFASTGRVSQYAGNVDLDAFRGDVDTLAAHGLFKDWRKAKPAPAKTVKPTRVERFRTGHVYDVSLLRTAIAKGGRKGAVKRCLVALEHAVASLPRDKNPHTRVREFVTTFHKHDRLDMPLLRAAVARGRTGKVAKAVAAIESAIKDLPLR